MNSSVIWNYIDILCSLWFINWCEHVWDSNLCLHKLWKCSKFIWNLLNVLVSLNGNVENFRLEFLVPCLQAWDIKNVLLKSCSRGPMCNTPHLVQSPKSSYKMLQKLMINITYAINLNIQPNHKAFNNTNIICFTTRI